MQRFKMALLTLLVTLGGYGVFGLASASAVTAPSGGGGSTSTSSQQDACAGLSQLDSSQSCGTGESSFTKVVKSVVTILSLIVGIVAVIMVIIAGLKYVTSGGDANGISSAKNTLIYALVGLAIAALAQFLVHFVLNNAKA